ncbi:helix-turn-helix transcriptional regulator [Flavobacterium sp. ENC]|uniref:helix-turn-helix transcriptional regulator n=1 Tax=Flavobacterium sp. ENC TaxID=2897330 RepID=UPI001E4EFD84|nr:helix-turn-helix transcriptional regulator [Flavobacterium sp. ENC]MCD0466999.1 helix-turn-helix transcriptional regulator [Flavobacterium sp. ENC]
MAEKINENIKSIRELKDYTQEYMAVMLNITQAGYSKIEKGTITLSCDKLEEIAFIFEMDLINLIAFESSLYLKNDFMKFNTSEQGNLSNIEMLYQDKIILLEKLLDKTNNELENYKDKYGGL